MKIATLANFIENYSKGSYAALLWKSYYEPKKAFPDASPLVKVTSSSLRLGVTYDNIQAVKDYREDGTLPATNQGLIGREWINFPYLKQSSKGNVLLACYLKSVDDYQGFNSSYYLNGVETDKDSIPFDQYLKKGSSSTPSIMFDLNIDNLIHIIYKDYIYTD